MFEDLAYQSLRLLIAFGTIALSYGGLVLFVQLGTL